MQYKILILNILLFSIFPIYSQTLKDINVEDIEKRKNSKVKIVKILNYEFRFGEVIENGKISSISLFNEDGFKLLDTLFTSNIAQIAKEYKYDDRDRLIEISSYDVRRSEPRLVGKEIYRYSNGEVEWIHYGDDGRVRNRETFKCDSQGFIVRDIYQDWEVKKNKDGDIIERAYPSIRRPRQKLTYTYSDAGVIIKSVTESFDIVGSNISSSSMTIHYNNDGYEKEIIIETRMRSARKTFEYDDIGFLTSSIEYEEGEPRDMTKYYYEYYNN